MGDEELDVVEFTDDEGNSLLLLVVDNFFYNGEEFAVLTEWEEGCDCEGEDCCTHDHSENEDEDSEEDEQEQNLYIMKVDTFIGEDGDEMEEFTPVDDELMDKLIEIVQTRFFDEDDEDGEEDGDKDEGAKE